MGRIIDKELKSQIPQDYCYYCGCKLNKFNRTFDHIKPISKGGEDSVENLVACCEFCNQVKADHTLSELLDTLRHQKKFCDDEVRAARLEFQEKIFSIAKQRTLKTK